jgi:7,8-dihydropterin-6-yl-methyl-4-(beta-D-ribofuranosyl)aminobenzene 5'-phosphate synthase
MKIVLIRLLLVCAVVVAGLVLLMTARQAIASAQIAREWQMQPEIIHMLQPTSHLEIVPLYEEAGDSSRFAIGHGVSYLIRTDALTLLMDVGNNLDNADIPPYRSNMDALGIDWEEIDVFFVSHAHPDHLGGLPAWQARRLSLGPEPGSAGDRAVYLASPLTVTGARATGIAGPGRVGADIATTGPIGYLESLPFSLRDPLGYEQALVVSVTGQGLVVITGCGHPTLEKLVARAEAAFARPVIGIVGGLHYEGKSAEDVQPHLQFLAARQPQLVALSPHDSSPEALQAFQTLFASAYQPVEVGRAIQFP